MDNFQVKTIVTSRGERLPILLNSGLPVFEPNLFAFTEIRVRGRASKTIERALTDISVFLMFLRLRGIDLTLRMRSGLLLTIGELDDLVRICRQPISEIRIAIEPIKTITKILKPIFLEHFRSKNNPKEELQVGAHSTATRLRCIRDYIEWLAGLQITNIDTKSEVRNQLLAACQIFIKAIEARIPLTKNNVHLNSREGLDTESESVLLEVTNANSPNNPWVNEHARLRNELIILWLLNLGLRRGELLGLRISAIRFHGEIGQVDIVRRADDIKDPRVRQPDTKTRERTLDLGVELLDKTKQYILGARNLQGRARSHNFLFVATHTGTPLTLSGFARIFKDLQGSNNKYLERLCAHLLRHTWNDRYSEEMDKRNVQEESEKKTRAYLMGWNETSNTSATYTRRHIRKKANLVSRSMQEEIMKGLKSGE